MTTVTQYKVLGAMLSLKEFDLVELARLSEVKLSTVRTIVSRQKEALLEVVTKQKRTGRGGRLVRYKLRPDQIQNLEKVLRLSFQEVTTFQRNHPSVPQSASEVPLSLLAAHDALLRRFPKSKSVDEKFKMVELAEIVLSDASIVGSHTDSSLAPRLRCLHLLIGLSKAELDFETNSTFDPMYFVNVSSLAVPLASEFANTEMASEGPALLNRLSSSPLLARSTLGPTAAASETKAGRAESGMIVAVHNSKVDRVLAEVKRISAIPYMEEQVQSAFAAAEREYHLVVAGGNVDRLSLDAHFNAFVKTIEPKSQLLLTDEQIILLATQAAFYCMATVIINGRSVILRVIRFLDAVRTCRLFKQEREYSIDALDPLELYACTA